MKEVIVSPGGMMKLKEDISSLQTAMTNANNNISSLGTGKLNANLKGAANGVAELDENGKVLSRQLLGVSLGSENAGKFLSVGSTGALELIQVPNANGQSF